MLSSLDVEDFDSLKKVILHSNISGAYILELCSKSSDSADLYVKLMDLVNSMGVSNEISRDFLVTKIIEKYNSQKLVNSMEVNNGVAETLKFDVVFVLGGPGCGKGTNCARIVAEFDYVHLSAGDLLRAARESGSELADMINTYIKEGRIVPAEITVGLLKTAMEQSGKKKFLVDGFPRDMSNLESWEASMSSVTTVQFLLFLDCSEETMLARLLEVLITWKYYCIPYLPNSLFCGIVAREDQWSQRR